MLSVAEENSTFAFSSFRFIELPAAYWCRYLFFFNQKKTVVKTDDNVVVKEKSMTIAKNQ
jgi:hypothetical protein